MSSVDQVLSQLRISRVYEVLTGRQARRTGADTYRGQAAWRDGDGLNVSLDDARGVWHDFASDEGGGVLDLVVRIRGGSREDALKWCAEFAGVALDIQPIAAADRADWAHRQRELERDLPSARYWRQAMVNITEELLVNLKAALFDPMLPRPAIGEIYHVEGMLTRFRARDGADLVAEYKSWCAADPGYTAMLVRAAKDRERANERALRRYLEVAG